MISMSLRVGGTDVGVLSGWTLQHCIKEARLLLEKASAGGLSLAGICSM